ncbi:MAG: glycosyltransferase family 2 protein, partial [Calditrichia bacterium]
AEQLLNNGRSVTLIGCILRGKLKFIKMYLLQLGFLDGSHGLILAIMSAYAVFIKYVRLWKLNH